MRFRKSYYLIAIAIIAIVVLTMSFLRIKVRMETNITTLPSIDDVPREYWAKLAEKKIYFGHQSVGYNIVEGIEDIIKSHPQIKLNVVKTCDPAAFVKPVFAHSGVGKNTEPDSKINDFVNIMDSGVGEEVDIAILKFCYVDITRDSEPQKIFNDYQTSIKDLKNRYPKIKFLHSTVPLRSAPKGIERNLKQTIKLILGKPGVVEDNIKRQCYNDLLRDAYNQTEPFFDLALVESVGPESKRYYAAAGTEKVYMMASEYTYDGGHLNSLGRKNVAEQFLIKLATLANECEE